MLYDTDDTFDLSRPEHLELICRNDLNELNTTATIANTFKSQLSDEDIATTRALLRATVAEYETNGLAALELSGPHALSFFVMSLRAELLEHSLINGPIGRALLEEAGADLSEHDPDYRMGKENAVAVLEAAKGFAKLHENEQTEQ